ncbi:MAG: hypothetical protein ACRC3B_18705 [Bacteroidia bacterium]
MEGMIEMDEDWSFLLLVFLMGILPILLAFVQLPLAAVHTIRRISSKRGVAGWVIYWILAITFLLYHITAEKHGMAEISDYFLLCYVPAIWFFFAGKLSDKRSKKTTELKAS